MTRLAWILGAVLGLIGVAAGAFGAHALADRLSPERLDTYQLATRYQLFHAIVLTAIGLAGERLTGRMAQVVVLSFLGGVIVFSGSLYALVLSGRGFWGAVTPFGGVLLLVGWASLFIAGVRSQSR